MRTEAMEAEVTVARETPAVPRKAAEAEAMEISEEENSEEGITRTISRSKEGENRHPIHNRDMNLGRKEK